MNISISFRSRSRLLAAFALFGSGFVVCTASATNGTWLNTGATDANWSTSSNWVGGTVPGATVAITGTNADTSIATFNTAVGTYGTSGTPILIDSTSQNIKGITFDSSSVGAFTIGTTAGNSLYLSSGGTIQMTGSAIANNEVINAPLVIEGAAGTLSILNNSTGAGTLTIGGGITGGNTGATVLTLGGTNTGANTISGVIGNGTATTVGLTKTGAGTWVLNGVAANTYTGATSVTAGTLQLDFSNASAPASGLLAGTSPLTLNGGILSIKGNSTGTTAQTLGNVTIGGGSMGGSGIILNPNGGSGTTLTLGNTWTRNAGGTLNIDVSAGGTLSTGLAASTLGYATVKDSTGVGFASASGTGVTRLTGQTTLLAASNAAATDFITAPAGTSTTGSPYLTMAGSFSANTLTIDTSSATGANFLSLGAGTLTLTKTGLLMTGSNDFTIQNGQLGAAATELIIHQMGSGILTVNGTISSSTGSLTKDGTGILILGGTNTYTGRTYINGGTLVISADTNLGTATNNNDELSFNGGTLRITANMTFGSVRRTSLFANGGTIEVVSGVTVTAPQTIGGPGTSVGTLTKTGLGTLILSSTSNINTGGIIVNAGTLSATGASGTSLGANTGTLTVNNTNTGTGSATVLNLQSGVDTTMGSLSGTVSQTGVTSGANTATITTQSARTFTVNQTSDATYGGVIGGSGNFTLGSLSTSKLTLSGVNTYSGNTTISAGTLSIGGAGQLGSGAYAGTITNSGSLVFNTSANQTLSGVVSGAGAFTQSGAGTTTLSNATNTYTGTTTITGGKLLVNGTTTGTAITVSQGALGGTGTVGSVTVANNAGAGVQNNSVGGVFTLGSLSFGGAGNLNVIDNSLSSARLVVTGALSTTPGNGTVTVTGSGTWLNGVNTLLSYGSFAGSIGDFTLGAISGLTSRQSLGSLSLVSSTLSLTINGDSPKWTGLDNGNWVVGTTGGNSNWKLITGGSATDYIAGDVVLFDDTASTAITPGAVNISAANVSPTSTTFNNSSIDYTVSSSGGFGIAGTGSLTKNGTGALNINTVNSYTGGTVINGGTVTVGTGGATLGATTGTLAVNNTNTGAGNAVVLNLATDADTTTGSLSGAIAAPSSGTNTVTINTASGHVLTVNQTTAGTYAGNIAGAGGFTLGSSSTATLIFSGTNTYAGNTVINAGTLKLGSGSALTSAALVGGAALSGAGTLDINGNSLAFTGVPSLTGVITSSSGMPTLGIDIAANGNFSGTLTGSLGLTKNGVGTLTLSGASANSYTGLTVINGGQVNLTKTTGVNAIGGDVQINSGATLFMGTIGGNQIADTATVTVNTGGMFNMNFQAETIGNIDVNGGSVTSGGTSTFNGALTIAGAGTTTVRNGGTLLMGNMTTGTGGVTLGDGATLTTTSGTGAIIRLNSNLVYNGTTTGATFGADVGMGGSTVNLGAATRTFTVADGAAAIDLTVSGVIANGGLIKTGLGTMTLTGVSTYTGGTTVNAGTLQLGVANAIAAGSAITLGGGTLNLGGFSQAAYTNALTLGASSTIDFGAHVTGLTLTFADSSAASWTGTLTLLNFKPGTDFLNFSSVAGLGTVQLSEISLAGYTTNSTLDGIGNVQFTSTMVPEPTAYAAILGALALSCVVIRRRRA